MGVLLESEINIIKNKLRADFQKPEVRKESGHLWRVGLKEKIYYDFDQIIYSPKKCEWVVGLFTEKVRDIVAHGKEVDFLAFIQKDTGGTTGALKLEGAISIATGIPSTTIRLDREGKAGRIKFPWGEGEEKKGIISNAKAILITDHCSSGKEILRAIKTLAYYGAKVEDIIAFTTNTEKIKENIDIFKEKGITIHTFNRVPEDMNLVGISSNSSSV